jgi:hypothetical protein
MGFLLGKKIGLEKAVSVMIEVEELYSARGRLSISEDQDVSPSHANLSAS